MLSYFTNSAPTDMDEARCQRACLSKNLQPSHRDGEKLLQLYHHNTKVVWAKKGAETRTATQVDLRCPESAEVQSEASAGVSITGPSQTEEIDRVGGK